MAVFGRVISFGEPPTPPSDVVLSCFVLAGQCRWRWRQQWEKVIPAGGEIVTPVIYLKHHWWPSCLFAGWHKEHDMSLKCLFSTSQLDSTVLCSISGFFFVTAKREQSRNGRSVKILPSATVCVAASLTVLIASDVTFSAKLCSPGAISCFLVLSRY